MQLEGIHKRIQDLHRFSQSGYRQFGYQDPTEADQEILPYVRTAQAEHARKAGRLRPLDILFSILNTGQFMSANVTEEVIRSIRTGEDLSQATLNALQAAWRGLTWQDKGTYQDVLFGREETAKRPGFEGVVSSRLTPEQMEKWEQPLIPFKQEGRGMLRPHKMLSLAADILLDPTTWVGLPWGKAIGPTRAATESARKFGQHKVRAWLKSGTSEAIEKLQKEGGELLAKGGVEGLRKKLLDTGQDTLARELDRVYRVGVQEALGKTGQELQEQMLGQVSGVKGLEDLVQQLSGAVPAYPKAGERAWRVMGKELFAGVRDPNIVERQIQTLKGFFDKPGVGEKIGDAWWAVMNRGVMGKLRNSFGFRNPWAKMHQLQVRQVQEQSANQVFTSSLEYGAVKLSDDMMKVAAELKDDAYRLSYFGKKPAAAALVEPGIRAKQMGASEAVEGLQENIIVNIRDLIRTPKYAKKLTPEEADQVLGLWNEIQRGSNQFHDQLMQAAAEGAIPTPGFVYNYIGTHIAEFQKVMGRKGRGVGTSIVKPKRMALSQHVDNTVADFKLIWGDTLGLMARDVAMNTDDFTRKLVTDLNLANVTLDLQEMLMHRAIAQAKVMERVNMVRAFRPFGIGADEVGVEGVRHLGRLGLVEAVDPGLAGLFFDPETARVFNNVYTSTATPDGIGWIKGAIGSYMSWWKGMVTVTTGFHMRNMFSNWMTGFLRFGPRWFNVRSWGAPSAVGTMYALHPEKYMDMATKKFKVSEGWVLRQLNKKKGDFTVKELADFARDSGVISHRTMGFADQRTIAQLTGKAKYSFLPTTGIRPGATKENIYFAGSRQMGDVIENSSRFQAFMMDYMDMFGKDVGDDLVGALSKNLGERLTKNDVFLHGAANEAKKWFIDYGNLTQFEKSWMKNIMPFYTWLRHNLSNQISGLVLYPELYSVIPKARRAMQQDEGFDYALQPDWQKNLSMYPVGRDPESGGWIMFRPDFPYKDLNLLPLTWDPESGRPEMDWADAMYDLLGAASPLIKTLVEVPTMHDVFRRQAIRKETTAPSLFQYLSKTPRVVQFMDGFLRMAGSQKGIRMDVERDRVVMDGRIAKIIENNMPLVRLLGTVLEAGETVADQVTDEEWEGLIQQAFGVDSDVQKLDMLFRALSTWGGVKWKMLDMAQAQDQYARKILQEAEEARREDRYKLPGYQRRSLSAQQAQARRRTRLVR